MNNFKIIKSKVIKDKELSLVQNCNLGLVLVRDKETQEILYSISMDLSTSDPRVKRLCMAYLRNKFSQVKHQMYSGGNFDVIGRL